MTTTHEDAAQIPKVPDTAELRVASKTPTQELAAAISHALYDGKKVVVRAIGAGAVNQAVKGMIVAAGYLAHKGQTLICKPGFIEVNMEGNERTAIAFYVSTL